MATEGTYTLTADITVGSSTPCFVISANGVVVDPNGHEITANITLEDTGGGSPVWGGDDSLWAGERTWTFKDSSRNGGIVNGLTTFNDESFNYSQGVINGDAIFNTTWYNSGSNSAVGGKFTLSGDSFWTGEVKGIVYGSDHNPITNYEFNDYTADYNGVIFADVVFNDHSFVESYPEIITITGSATFNDTSYNYNGTIHGNVTFNENSWNDSAFISGDVTFNDYSYNWDENYLYDNNGNYINGNVTFNDHSYNTDVGIINGTTTFNGVSYNAGNITGNVSFAGAETYNTGTINGGSTFSGAGSFNAGDINVPNGGTVDFSGVGSYNNGIITNTSGGDVNFSGGGSFNASDYAYVIGGVNQIIQKFDVPKMQEPIDSGSAPSYDVKVSPGGLYIYAVNGGFINKIDSRNIAGGSIDSGSTGDNSVSLTISPNGRYAYVVSTGSQLLEKFDTNNLSAGPVASVYGGVYPYNVVISSDGLYVYVMNTDNCVVKKFDASSLEQIGSDLTVGNAPISMTISPDDDYLYVVNDSAPLQKIDTQTMTEVASIDIHLEDGVYPFSVDISPDGLYLYVIIIDWGDNYYGYLQKIRTSDMALVGDMINTSSISPQDIVVSSDGLYVYIVSYYDSFMEKYRTSDMAFITNISVAEYPSRIALSKAGL